MKERMSENPDPMASPADMAPCPVCGDRTNHAHVAVTWLAKTAGMDPEQAEPTIADLSRAVGTINAVRVLEVLLAAGWRAPERGAE